MKLIINNLGLFHSTNPHTMQCIGSNRHVNPAYHPLRWCRIIRVLLIAAVTSFLLPGFSFAQSAQFSFQSESGNFCAPAQIKFTPVFSETPISYFWQTGIDDDETDVLSPNINYSIPGTYKVTLVVLFSNVIREVTKNITIHGSPQIEISPDRNFICQPGEVMFSLNSNVSITKTTWDFGDGGNADAPPGSQPASHLFKNFGTFQVSVATTDVNGCEGYGSLLYEVKRPTAVLIDSPANGCLPVEVNFQANVNVPDGSKVISYQWDFADGSSKLITDTNFTKHTYTSSDSIYPTLSIITSEGCTNTFQFDVLSFGSVPDTPDLLADKYEACASDILYFTALSANANKFYWEVSDGNPFAQKPEITTINNTFSFKFNTLGEHKVWVAAENNGCKGASDSVTILIRGLVADFNFANACDEKNRFQFRNTSDGTSNSVRWTFGDSLGVSSSSRPVFTFPEQGNFPVVMIVRENASGCADTATTIIYTAKPALIPSDSLVCIGNSLTLGVSTTYNSPRTAYIWTLGGRNYQGVADSSFTVIPSVPGEFVNRVIINNGSGYCRDTLFQSKPMLISGPVASFVNTPIVCQNEKVFLEDKSTTEFGMYPIVAWNWDFGNGTKSNEPNPQPVQYETFGNYNITLEVVDVNGCKSMETERVKINRLPLLRVIPRSQKVCQGQEISLTALHRSPVKWSSSSVAFDCDTCSVVKLSPQTPVKIVVRAVENSGCISTDSVSLDIWNTFEIPPGVLRDTAICLGASVPFDLKTTGKFVTWSPSTGLSSSVIPNPVANPVATTLYTATVTDSGRCFIRTANARVEVNPIPVIDPGPDMVLAYSTPFTIKPFYSPGISTYRWQPANMLSCANCPEPSGVATVSTLFTINVTTEKGCSSSARIRLTIDCSDKNLQMPTAFSPNKDGLNDYYYPLTRGISLIKRFVIYNRLGELVFERKNFTPNNRSLGWDGTYKGRPQPLGGYVYFVEATCDLGNDLSTKGNFVLMR